jgi:hypothetical protein
MGRSLEKALMEQPVDLGSQIDRSGSLKFHNWSVVEDLRILLRAGFEGPGQ